MACKGKDKTEVASSGAGMDQAVAPWRSLEEHARDRSVLRSQYNEFVAGEMEWGDETSRRTFLKIMGASLALAGMAGAGGCTEKQPEEKILPYVRQPESMVPGVPLFFASTCPWGGYGRGVLVESHEGRPTKIEGNPSHPASVGGTDAWTQASVLDLYDPDRLQAVSHVGRASDWDAFHKDLDQATNAKGQAASQANVLKGVSILTSTVTSPTLGALLKQLVAGGAKWHQYEPVWHDNALRGARLAFGTNGHFNAVYHFDKAKRILSLDEDFLIGLPGSVRYARDFASKRKWRRDNKLTSDTFSRLYMVEATRSLTGAMSDERLAMRPSEIADVALAVGHAIGVEGVKPSGKLSEAAARFVSAAAKDLREHGGESLVVAGESQPAHVHALVHLINARLKNVGATVRYIQSPEVEPVVHLQSLTELVGDMRSGDCHSLLILGGNPAYDAPADVRFADELLKFAKARHADESFVHLTAHLTQYDNETTHLCQWALPRSHWLETWGDLRAFDGTASIIQPLIYPLYATQDDLALLSVLINDPATSAHDAVQAYWKKEKKGSDPFDAFWQTALEGGVIAGTTPSPQTPSLDVAAVVAGVGRAQGNASPSESADALELIYRPDPTVWDGSFSNNAWLQELPKPLLKTTWDNVIALSPATAVKLGLANADEPHKANQKVIRVTHEGRTLEGAVWVWPGHADGCLTLFLGYGRSRGGAIATGTESVVIVESNSVARAGSRGYNAYALRTGIDPWWASDAQVELTDQRLAIACTQNYQMIAAPDRRDLTRRGTVEQANHDLDAVVPQKKTVALSLYPPRDYASQPNSWAMMIDNAACIGCNACMTACQAENNIPSVGKAQVMAGRQMHWIRIDTYFDSDPSNATAYFEPVPCMHCELAPCEAVCPVEATTHSAEGLNEMTYNRCIGTRYCSNNCPYKVRRFNFLLYSNQTTDSLKMQRNPDVTVRTRGVMEKCTYCVQRINEARIVAEREGRPIGPTDIQTACQQACPTQAIVFGNQNDPQAEVTALKKEPLKFDLLEELNTRPRTSYLARLTNPNPALSDAHG